MMQQINTAIQIPQLNLREMKTKGNETGHKTISGRSTENRHTHYASNIDLVKAKGLPQKPDQLFMQWKSELERHTDLQPLFEQNK